MSNQSEIECTLTPEMAKLIKENFNLEVEFLSGYIRTLPDGRKQYAFSCCEEKGEMIKEFILRCIAINMHRKESLN